VLCSLQDHLRTRTHDLDHPILVGAKNTDSWHARKGDLQHAFPLDISIVSSLAITVATNDECLTCSGFSVDETIRLGNFEFIADYFSVLSLSPRRGDSSAAFMGSTRSETPSLWRAMIEDSPEEFLTVPSEEGGFGLPSPRRSGTGAPHAPVTTTPWIENAPATQATTMVPSRTVAPRPDTGLPFEQCHTHQGASKCKPVLGSSSPSRRQRHGEARSASSKPLLRSGRTRHRDTSLRSRWRGS
jgi:hypothetical protein